MIAVGITIVALLLAFVAFKSKQEGEADDRQNAQLRYQLALAKANEPVDEIKLLNGTGYKKH